MNPERLTWRSFVGLVLRACGLVAITLGGMFVLRALWIELWMLFKPGGSIALHRIYGPIGLVILLSGIGCRCIAARLLHSAAPK